MADAGLPPSQSACPAEPPADRSAAQVGVDERLPWPRTLAPQHVLSRYAGAVALPLLVGSSEGNRARTVQQRRTGSDGCRGPDREYWPHFAG